MAKENSMASVGIKELPSAVMLSKKNARNTQPMVDTAFQRSGMKPMPSPPMMTNSVKPMSTREAWLK